ncbi:hypothetical protein GYMLUDRAFT_195040 [Collybiopsis luxurians FD-317 M1]|nr:hypothetical protein GYMLUDRAFT_195040 [Collybiopsis luxurians FD-317 M1]
MGAALGTVAAFAIPAVLSFFTSKRTGRNPAMTYIELTLEQERLAREQAQRRLEEIEAAQDQAERDIEEERRERAREHKADLRQAQAALEQATEAANTAKEAQAKAEREAQISHIAQAEANRRADEEKALAEAQRIAREKAEEEAAKVVAELNEAKENWLKGIQPIVLPTEEEYRRVLQARQYKEGYFHFAVAGTSGCGKSSLINAFRGILNGLKNAAAVGVTETTRDIGRYEDPRQEYRFVWYDIPGAGTLQVPRWQYFNSQGLFIFDAIIVLWNDRFTDTDIAIIDNCARFRIPCFIVRSKSDNHIRAIANDMKDLIEANDDIDEEERERLLDCVASDALEQYRTETGESVKENLQKKELPPQRVYLVTNRTLCKVVKGSRLRAQDQDVIDEDVLIHDILTAVRERCCAPRTGPSSTGSRLTEGWKMVSSAFGNATNKWRA